MSLQHSVYAPAISLWGPVPLISLLAEHEIDDRDQLTFSRETD